MYSVYDLAYYFIKRNNLYEIGPIGKKNIINEIVEALNNGATDNDIYKKITKVKENYTSYVRFFKDIRPNGNLLEHSKIARCINKETLFYHNELRLKPNAPLVKFDLDSGEMVKEEQEYFLEMRASYTVDDICDYISRKEFLRKAVDNRPRAIGGLKVLIKRYSVDKLLFIIDAANDSCSARSVYLKSVLDISDYECEGLSNYKRKITECAISDTDKVVYKRRKELQCAR